MPWAGGALFLPQFRNVSKSEAGELITALTRWSIWTQVNKTDQAQVTPLDNNLRSFNLWHKVDPKNNFWRQAKGIGWLLPYSETFGTKAAEELLREQGATEKLKANLNNPKK